MDIKRALIVDDSKTAQFKLKKILDIYELKVDLAQSAEDALSHLAYQVPDIIFMDHSMKGMSGLDAVKIIKSNSATATIPVVMYTAEKGDVYLSQARAIGALDVISKDVMVESDIQRVMQSVNIHLIEKDTQNRNTAVLDNDPIYSSESSDDILLKEELGRIQQQVSQGLRIQQSHISRDIQDNTRLMTRRFMHELRNMQAEIKQNQKQQRELAVSLATPVEPPKTPSFLWAVVPLLMLLGATIYGALEISQIKQDNDLMRGIYKELATGLAEQNSDVLEGLQKIENNSSSQSTIRSEELLSALVWAVNQNGQFAFSKQALGDDRIGLVSGLLNFLDQAQFRGTMTLGIHSGNFCVTTDQSGQLTLPTSGVVSTDCELLSNYERDFNSAAQTSTSFMNFLNTSPVVESGDLKIDIQSHGIYSPSHEYPTYSTAISTEDWNSIASANNRLTVSLQAE